MEETIKIVVIGDQASDKVTLLTTTILIRNIRYAINPW
jgi:hypothetical protein